MAEETGGDSPNVNRSWRRISTGKLSFLYSEEKILPNYLRSPTGSCHDVCKYGSKLESQDGSRAFSPLKKRGNRSFSGTLSFDSSSPLKKKALTKSVLNPSLGSGGGGSSDQVRNFSRRVCDVNMENAERTRIKKAATSLSDSPLADSNKRKKKTKMVSHSLKTFGMSRGRALEMVEHNKRITALKLKSVAETAAMALRRSTVNRKKVNNEEPKKTVVASRVSSSLKTKKKSHSLSSSVVPLRKNRKLVDEKCIKEKTLYVIKMKTEDKIVESDQNNQRCIMDSSNDDDTKSEKSQDNGESIVAEPDDESSQEEPGEDENENESFSEDKSKAFSTESAVNGGKSMKLRFKRGKIVNFESQDNNSPRKLKFKRGKILAGGAERSSNSGERRNLKPKGTNFSYNKEQQHKPKSLEVALKHQDTEEKRDSRALLYNNVIEETANKLVETRKSKVKALVGAFESVISLQEKNSSTTT